MKQSVTICSVFFRPVTARRNYKPYDDSRGYNSEFHIDACKPGEHKTLKVGNHFERNYIGEKRYMDTPVYADGVEGLGACLVNEWAFNVIGGEKGGPGIFVCEGDEPTQAEIDRAIEKQTAWANHLCLLAEVEWINGRKTNIDSMQREAAVWLGRGDEYEWVSDRGTARVQVCPMCAKPADARAVVCPNCHNVIDFNRYTQYLEKKLALEAQLKAAGITPPAPPVAAPLPPPVKNPQQRSA